MSIDLVALVRVPHSHFMQHFEEVPDDRKVAGAPQVLQGDNGLPFGVTALGDATLVWTPIPFGGDPHETGVELRTLLGPVLDAHTDSRGIFALPDRAAKLKATRYDDAITEAGELGDWVPIVSGEEVAAAGTLELPAGLADLQNVMGAIPPDALEAMQRAMASGDMNALANVHEQLEKAMGPGGMEALQAQLMGALEQMGGMEALQGMAGMPGGMNEDEIVRRAEEEIERLRREDPAKLAELERRFGPGATSAPASAPATRKNPPKSK